MLQIGNYINSETAPEESLMSMSLTPSNSQPYNQRPSICMPAFPNFPFSKVETSLSSSIAYLSCLADLCLRALRKVSGWNKSARLTGCLSRAYYWTFAIQFFKAWAFLVTALIQLLGTLGPSYKVIQLSGTSPFNRLIAIFSVSGVNVSNPYSTYEIDLILSLTLCSISITVWISMYTKASIGSEELRF